MVVYLLCALARQERRAGSYTGALEWLRRAELAAEGRRVGVPLADLGVLRGAILVETGQPEKGLQLLRQTETALEQVQSPLDLAQCLFFAACGAFRAGQPAEAARLLGQALAQAEAVGYDQMLLSEAERASDLLEACRSRPELEARAAGLLARARGLAQVRASLAERGILPPAPQAAAAPRAGLDVRFLGQGQVLQDGREVERARWNSRLPRELFFWIVDNAPVSRERALALFWPEMPTARAVGNLYQTLYRLRRAVGGDVILLDNNTFQLAPGHNLRSDVAQFEAVARAALGFSHSDLRRLGALENALALYRGQYLADVDAPWTDVRRRALADQFVRLLSEYADELLGLTRYGDARHTLARALALEPLRDDLHGRMLVCLAALGRRHEVVDHYRRYRETLRAELGLDPPAEIRALYARLIE
jgi:DNA-binding SARP family transcriptional activator